MRCPVCEYPAVTPRYQLQDRFFQAVPGRFQLYECSSCGLLFQDEEQIRLRLDTFYPSGYWWQEEGSLGTLERRYRQWMIRHDHLGFVLSIFPEPAGVRLLDIGCGSGGFVRAAQQAGFDAYGLERSPEAAALARIGCEGRIFECSEEDLIAGNEVFDVLVLFHCLEHVLEPFRYLKRLQKLLRRPGNLIVQVPNRASLQARWFGSGWYGLDCPRHVYNYTAFSLMYLLGRCGYRVHRLRHFSLRDNAAALVSSLLPPLDPMSNRVRAQRRGTPPRPLMRATKEALYLTLLMLAQPLALLEAWLGKGATVTVHTTLEG